MQLENITLSEDSKKINVMFSLLYNNTKCKNVIHISEIDILKFDFFCSLVFYILKEYWGGFCSTCCLLYTLLTGVLSLQLWSEIYHCKNFFQKKKISKKEGGWEMGDREGWKDWVENVLLYLYCERHEVHSSYLNKLRNTTECSK